MPFPITGPLTPDQFRAQIIDHYWANHGGKPLQQKIDEDASCLVTSKAALIDDYCKIGSFLSNRVKVLAGLVRLENAIRAELSRNERAALRGQVDNFGALRTRANQAKANLALPESAPFKNRRNEPIVLKTGKLLSGVFAAEEMRCGFNGLNAMAQPVARSATLHSQARVGVKDAQGNVVKTGGGFQVQPGGRGANTVNLPSGVPGMTGGVKGMDFNRILLRHGYQWKDVGAGALDHGEYTHRVQWYAITTNNTTSVDLGLANTPLQIFQSMGCLFARSTWPLPVDDVGAAASKTYLWEAVFDCFAKLTSGSIAIASPGVFNCPDHLNTELSKLSGAETPEFKADPDNLYCLRALMSARRFKRFATNPDPLRNLMADNKKVKEAYIQDNADAYLAWYVTE
ncbi:hypothetical protein GCM10023165_36830 [Variovorax defluvii]|uniref:DUF5636 domain-containing protein n=1 Tax=Variovorax defluvii TaxID=913761 RepID=A0ABP8I2K1_9BURK